MEEAIPLTESQKILLQKAGCEATTQEGFVEWVALLKRGYHAGRRAFFAMWGEVPGDWKDEAAARLIPRRPKK